MANLNQTWLLPALTITLLIHFMAISPLASWLSRNIIPAFSDSTIEIDLSEIKTQQRKPDIVIEKEPEIEIEKPPELKKEPEPVKPPELEEETESAKPLEPKSPVLTERPEEIVRVRGKKYLDPELIEDRIINPDLKTLPLQKPPSSFAQIPQVEKLENRRLIEKKSPEPEQQKEEPTEKKELERLTESKKPDKLISTSLEPPKKVAETEKSPNGVGEEITSPIFITKPEKPQEAGPEKPAKKSIPEEIEETIRNGEPEKTDDKNLEFSMNSYKWTFERYMENWAVDIQRWWKPPLDYAMGNVPEGGDMWIQVRLGKSGKLLGYRIVTSEITAEMELMVIQALVGSLARPSMPESFPEESLIINWHFIYPPLRPRIDLRR